MRGQLITSVAITVFTFGLLTAFKVERRARARDVRRPHRRDPVHRRLRRERARDHRGVAQGHARRSLIVAGAMFLYQEFESRILVPRVYGRMLRLSPAIVLVALLVGGTLLGILGALLALPVAAGLQMIVRELRVELPGEGPAARRGRTRTRRAGRAGVRGADRRRAGRKSAGDRRADREAARREARGARRRSRAERTEIARLSVRADTGFSRARPRSPRGSDVDARVCALQQVA